MTIEKWAKIPGLGQGPVSGHIVGRDVYDKIDVVEFEVSDAKHNEPYTGYIFITCADMVYDTKGDVK